MYTDIIHHTLAGKDELFWQFFGALEKIQNFRRMPDGNDDQMQLDRATNLFHNVVQDGPPHRPFLLDELKAVTNSFDNSTLVGEGSTGKLTTSYQRMINFT
ncbi:hypothetical protein ACS0TY_018004 [Phlomoides rotata]